MRSLWCAKLRGNSNEKSSHNRAKESLIIGSLHGKTERENRTGGGRRHRQTKPTTTWRGDDCSGGKLAERRINRGYILIIDRRGEYANRVTLSQAEVCRKKRKKGVGAISPVLRGRGTLAGGNNNREKWGKRRKTRERFKGIGDPRIRAGSRNSKGG